MNNITEIKPETFEDVVNRMARLRIEGDSSMVKRENFNDYPQISSLIKFGVTAFPFASFGYVERLIRKLSAEYPGIPFSKMVIEKYREACGFFSGELEINTGNSDSQKVEKIKFSWSGKGEIENTWDKFVEWQIETTPKSK
jgi:hypothetical protein